MKFKKKTSYVLAFVIILICIFISDDIQQRRFYNLNCGYECMEQGNYIEAITFFNEYLDVKSEIYWYLIEKVNGHDSSREGVSAEINECIRKSRN